MDNICLIIMTGQENIYGFAIFKDTEKRYEQYQRTDGALTYYASIPYDEIDAWPVIPKLYTKVFEIELNRAIELKSHGFKVMFWDTKFKEVDERGELTGKNAQTVARIYAGLSISKTFAYLNIEVRVNNHLSIPKIFSEKFSSIFP